ncbi:Uncharacterized protein Adt_43035 [Abeliophyllum distichum]|uniref:Transposase (putative) gypsy type domain-containing protein n=1 Tax=Abeliophyllum distichum TaxID=126358 RepID=A0ABD1PW57_9LAMI
MSTGVEKSIIRRSEEEASPLISPSMEGVLPIRGVDADTGEVVAIPVASLREAEDLYRVDVVRWAALDVPSIMVAEDMNLLRDAYKVPSDIELLLPDLNERACFPRRGCTALSLNAFVSGMRLPLHPFFRRILRAYGLAPTQVSPNSWGQMVGGLYLWFRHSFGMEMPLHVFQTMYQPRKLPKKKGKDEEPGWVEDDLEPDLDVPSVYGIASALPRCELSREVVDVLRSIYQAPPVTRRYEFILNRHRCLIKLGLMIMDKEKRPRPAFVSKEAVEASKVIEVEDSSAPEGDVPLSRKRKSRAPGTGAPQGSVEIVDDYAMCSDPPLQRTLAVNTSGEVVLEDPPRLSQKPGGTEGGPYEFKRRLRELIGAPGARIPDDVLRNVPFYHSMGAQAVKKYFTPKWEEFSSHGDLEDVLEASLASAIRASAMQMKVLGEFRTQMQEQRRLSVAASKSDKEHKQALEGLQAALDSARMAYEQLEAHLKESDSNVLNLTKQLDNANAAQKQEGGRVGRCPSDGGEEGDGGKAGEREGELENVEAEFVANFHNTEAYTNFSDYFARVGQQEVLAVLRNDHPNFDIGTLEARFPPPDVGSEEDS